MAIMRYGGAWTARGLIMMCLMPRAISCQTATCVGTRATIPVAHMLGWSRSVLPTKRIMIHCSRDEEKSLPSTALPSTLYPLSAL